MDIDESSSSPDITAEPLLHEESTTHEHAVSKPDRVTNSRMTKFEKAHILGVRALQLSMSAPPLVDIEDEIDPLKIALKELNEGKIPFVVRRRLPDGSFEEWSVKEMVIPYD
ncbi:subunit common to RNA polymerases I [Conglomerata obtusa]